MNRNFIERLLCIAAIFFLFCGNDVYGQQYAKIKLKDFTVLKNVPVYGFDSTGVFLKGVNENGLQKLNFDDIRVMTFQRGFSSNDIPEMNYPESSKRKLYHHIALGPLVQEGDINFSGNIINGYRLHEYVNAGVGLGYNGYEHISTVPVFAEVKGYLMRGRFVPYYFIHAGHGFMVKNRFATSAGEHDGKGGLLWSTGIGYQISTGENSITLSMAYHNQRSAQKYSFGDFLDIEEKRTYKRVELKIGLLF